MKKTTTAKRVITIAVTEYERLVRHSKILGEIRTELGPINNKLKNIRQDRVGKSQYQKK